MASEDDTVTTLKNMVITYAAERTSSIDKPMVSGVAHQKRRTGRNQAGFPLVCFDDINMPKLVDLAVKVADGTTAPTNSGAVVNLVGVFTSRKGEDGSWRLGFEVIRIEDAPIKKSRTRK
jgi:hypothetical protein